MKETKRRENIFLLEIQGLIISIIKGKMKSLCSINFQGKDFIVLFNRKETLKKGLRFIRKEKKWLAFDAVGVGLFVCLLRTEIQQSRQ